MADSSPGKDVWIETTMRTRIVTAATTMLVVLGFSCALLIGGRPASGAGTSPGAGLARFAVDAAVVGAKEPPGHGEDNADVELNPLAWRSDLAIWTGVVFVLLLVVLAKFAWGPIIDGLDKREQRVAGEIAAAEKSNADARQLLADYQQKLDSAGSEIQQMIEAAKREAEEAGRQILHAARDDAEAEKRRALENIEAASTRAMRELAEQSAHLAVELAGKIVRAQLSPADHAALIDEAVAKFSRLEPGKN